MAVVSERIQSELFRLAYSLNYERLDMNDNPINEDQYITFLNHVILYIEKNKYATSVDDNRHLDDYNNDEFDENKNDEKAALKKKEKKFKKHAKETEEDLRTAIITIEDIPRLREKLIKQSNNLGKEKSHRIILEDFIKSQNNKISLLVEHIEKLMKALKFESVKTMKILDSNKQLLAFQSSATGRMAQQDRLIKAKSRLINELQEGSKVLEDQLRLMDEKYLELRTKLDVARNQFSKEIKHVKKECTILRHKYSAAFGGNMLDKHPLPPEGQEIVSDKRGGPLSEKDHHNNRSSHGFQINNTNDKYMTLDQLNQPSKTEFMALSPGSRPSSPNRFIAASSPTKSISGINNFISVVNQHIVNAPPTLNGKLIRPGSANLSPIHNVTFSDNRPRTSGGILTGNSLGEFSVDKIMNKIETKRVKKFKSQKWNAAKLAELLG
eukprot:gene5460-7558_t